MSWVAVGMTAVGAVTAANSRKAAQEQNQKQAEMAAAQTQYSAWTGAAPGEFTPQAVPGGALQGAATGALSGMMYKNANAKTPETPTPPAEAAAPLGKVSQGFDMKQMQGPNPNVALGPEEEERRKRMMAGIA